LPPYSTGFATFCENAEREQLRVSLEFIPFNQITNLAINLVDTLRALKSTGANVIYDVEVFKAPLRAEAREKRAQLRRDAASAVIQKL
jgi:hypothetical protein